MNRIEVGLKVEEHFGIFVASQTALCGTYFTYIYYLNAFPTFGELNSCELGVFRF